MTRQQIYECKECEHRIKIYETEEQAVFCGCEDEGHPMIPVVQADSEEEAE